MSALALVMQIPKWPFAVLVWVVLGLAPPLVSYYRNRDWRIPWWHWPIAVGVMALGVKIVHDYVHGHLYLARYGRPPGALNAQHIALYEIALLIRYSAWLGIPIFLVSLWLTWKRDRGWPGCCPETE